MPFEIETSLCVKCQACEKQFPCSKISPLSVLNNHYSDNPTCLKWNKLLENDVNAKFIQKMYALTQVQIKDSLKCDNCDTEYSNIGNLNKHYKNHPECLKINFYNLDTVNTTKCPNKHIKEFNHEISVLKDLHIVDYDPTIDIVKSYFLNWPKSLYNHDLRLAKRNIIEYLNTVSVENKTILIDCDDTIFFGDPEQVIGIREMELGMNEDGHEIFILPINREIKDIVLHAKNLGFNVVFWSARPLQSRAATIENLEMFDIPYNELIVNENDEDPDFKIQIIEKLSSRYNIVCTIGDQEFDCYLPYAVRLPNPESKKVQIYFSGDVHTNFDPEDLKMISDNLGKRINKKDVDELLDLDKLKPKIRHVSDRDNLSDGTVSETNWECDLNCEDKQVGTPTIIKL